MHQIPLVSNASSEPTNRSHTSSVASVNWSKVPLTPGDNRLNNLIIVNPPPGNRFYRLFKP